MKKCSTFEILHCLAHGGYIVESCTTRDIRKVKLMAKGESSSSPAKLVGYVPRKMYEMFCNSGIIAQTGNSMDKYKTQYGYFALIDLNAQK